MCLVGELICVTKIYISIIKIVLTIFQDSFKAIIPKKKHRSCQAEICLVYRIVSCDYVPCLVWQAPVGRTSNSTQKQNFTVTRFTQLVFPEHTSSCKVTDVWICIVKYTESALFCDWRASVLYIWSKPAKCHAVVELWEYCVLDSEKREFHCQMYF